MLLLSKTFGAFEHSWEILQQQPQAQGGVFPSVLLPVTCTSVKHLQILFPLSSLLIHPTGIHWHQCK